MDRFKRILISILVFFISFYFIDVGKTILVLDNIQIHLNHNQNSDLEIPHQHNLNKSDDGEKWMNSNSFELPCSSEKHILFSCYPDKKTEDYAGLIWQPPKSM